MLHDPGQWFAFNLSGWTTTWPTQLLAIIWILWVISWVLASVWSGQTKKHVMTWDSLKYRLPIFAGAILFLPLTGKVLGEKPLWQFGSVGIYALACLVLAGISFTWWARIHLGRFWSNAITHKEGHQVIDTGPYGLVRHPIYTGLIFGMLVTGVAVGTVTAMLGAVPIAVGYGAGGEARQPLGLVVVGGLLFSQLVTLYLTPVVFTYMAHLQRWVQSRRGSPREQELVATLN